MAAKSPAEILLEKHLREIKIGFVAEFKFHSDRKWRFDFVVGPILGVVAGHMRMNPYHPTNSFAIEIEGGTWSKSRHGHGKGFEADCEKYNTATMMGWRILRFSTGQVLRGEAREFLRIWLAGR